MPQTLDKPFARTGIKITQLCFDNRLRLSVVNGQYSALTTDNSHHQYLHDVRSASFGALVFTSSAHLVINIWL
jgi:hypothetical protein